MTRDEMTALGRRILAESTAAKHDARLELTEWTTAPALAEVEAAYEAAHGAQLLAARLVLFSEREAWIAEPMLDASDHESGTRDDRVARWAEMGTVLEAVLPLLKADALTREGVR